MSKDSGIAIIKPEFLDSKVEVAEQASDDCDGGKTVEKEGPRTKQRGQNKRRPPPHAARNAAGKLCSNALAGRDCSFGEKCKYKHDISAFLTEKPPDIADVCYNFKSFGKCPYGAACRFAKHHLTPAGANVTDEARWQVTQKQVSNDISKELVESLRKRRYDFAKSEAAIARVFDDIKQANKHGDSKNEEGNAEMEVDGREDECVERENGVHGGARIGTVIDEAGDKPKREAKRLDLSGKLYLAPLTTVGNLPFRRICKRFGADVTCGEMAMCTNLLQGSQSEWALVKRHATEDVFGVQVCGAHVDTMTRCAQLLSEQASIDFIDVNLGCPIDLVYSKGAGSALMERASRLQQILAGMSQVTDLPITLKMRTGVYSNRNTAHKLIDKLKTATPVSLISLHGRSRESRYTKLADWQYIEECAKVAHPTIPFFGCGDILSYEDVARHKEVTGLTGVMIARGALYKPWIFTEIKEQRHWDISANERLEMLRDFVNFGMEQWGSDQRGVDSTRRFLLEWLSFTHRYIPVGLLEQAPQKINQRPPRYVGRSDLETLMASGNYKHWIQITEMLLGPTSENFEFLPKHKANAF